MRVSKEEEAYIEGEVQSLLRKGAIVVTPAHRERECFLSTIFTVPKKGGERRPIINLKSLNKFVPHCHFKMEGIQSLRDIVLQGDFMIKLDLKDAYLAIPIHPTHQKYLSFRWRNQVYQFTCLPFGLSSAPRTFTKTLKPVITYFRSLGVRIVVYLDDMLVLEQTREQLVKWRGIILDLLENLGFLINYAKSELEPSQIMRFLGFVVNTITMQLLLPKEKVAQTVKEAQTLLRTNKATARQLAHLIGLFTSTLPAILPAPLHYRGLQDLKHAILRRSGFDMSLLLTAEAREDLEWWIRNLHLVNGRGLVREQPSMAMETDASLAGWGAVCQDQTIGGPWTTEEKLLHINCLELLGAKFAVQAFAKDKQNVVIQLHLDNTTAIAYINHMGGTRSTMLCSMARALWDWCLQRHIFLVASHIPGRINVEADHLSRTVTDRHDWQLNPTVFQELNSLWGPLEVDLFATRITRQVTRFYSWKPDPLAEATDAFRQNWSGLKGFANPPWGLVGRCLQHVLQEEATIVLVTPFWPAQVWFPALFPLLLDFPRLLPERPDLLVNHHRDYKIPLPDKACRLVAWYISGDRTRVQDFQMKQSRSSWHHGEHQQPRITTPPGESGSNGVWERMPIQFLPL